MTEKTAKIQSFFARVNKETAERSASPSGSSSAPEKPAKVVVRKNATAKTGDESLDAIVVKRDMCVFANPIAYALDENAFFTHEKYKERVTLLKDHPRFKEVAHLTVKEMSLEDRQYVPQDDPRWLEFRKEPQLTASVSAELVGIHDEQAAGFLGLPTCMFVKPPSANAIWGEYLKRTKLSGLPSRPMDPPGNIYCAYGKEHEINPLAILMHELPTMKFIETGATVITEAHLQHFEIRNPFKDGARITSLPFRLVISPDGKGMVPEYVITKEDGQMLFGPLTASSIEFKTPTYYGEKNGSKYYGCEFYPKGSNCKPYNHIKEYYLQQTVLEMLALKCQMGLFCSQTMTMGMNTWKVEMGDKFAYSSSGHKHTSTVLDYLGMLLGILIHLHDKFITKDKDVPTSYFFGLVQSHPHRMIYEQFLALTKTICDETKPYLVVNGTKTTAILSSFGFRSTDTFHTFPHFREKDYLPFQLLAIYGHRLVHDFTRIANVKSTKETTGRIKNLRYLADTQLTQFSGIIIDDLLSNPLAAPQYAAEIRDDFLVQNRLIEYAETYLFELYKLVFKCYGSPPFGAVIKLPSGADADGLDIAVFRKMAMIMAIRLDNVVHNICDGKPFDLEGVDAHLSPEETEAFDDRKAAGVLLADEWAHGIMTTIDAWAVKNKVDIISHPDAVYHTSGLGKHLALLSMGHIKFGGKADQKDASATAPHMWQYARLLACMQTMRTFALAFGKK